MARPKKEESLQNIGLKAAPEIKAAIEAKAKEIGISAGTYARQLLLKGWEMRESVNGQARKEDKTEAGDLTLGAAISEITAIFDRLPDDRTRLMNALNALYGDTAAPQYPDLSSGIVEPRVRLQIDPPRIAPLPPTEGDAEPERKRA